VTLWTGDAALTVRPKAPTLDDQREALLSAWLEVRLHVTPTRFRDAVRGQERRVCAEAWGKLRRIYERYARTLATDEARRDAAKDARRWAALEAWALDEREGTALPELAGYDPTRGRKLSWEAFAGKASVPRDDPDYPWGSWLDPDVLEHERRLSGELGDKLRAAGWVLDDQPTPPEQGEALRIVDANVACADALIDGDIGHAPG
jgi:hypothetical protein